MKSKFLFLIIGLAGTIVSCSRKDAIQPTELATPVGASQVKIVNGRLVFADQKSLDQVRSELRTLALNAPSGKTLGDWEQNIGFKSLRASAAQESVNLEAKQAANQSTPAYDLVSKFGFPNFIASLINSSGEYQVGDQIYWFHGNAKYQAGSETELASIKKDPASAKLKSYAGLSVVNPKKGTTKASTPFTTNEIFQGNNVYADHGYLSKPFPLNGDNNSQRRIIYDLHVYTQDDGVQDGLHKFYTALYLQIKYEYYASRHDAWYPANGQKFDWQTQFKYTATATVPGQSPQPSNPGIPNYNYIYFYQNGNFTDNGPQVLQLADAHIASASNVNSSNVLWDFDAIGSIEGHPDVDTGHSFVANNSPLW